MKTQWLAATLAVVTILTVGGTAIGFIACEDDKIVTQKDLKNRVPDVQTAQKASQDAQAAAASAQASLNAIQGKIDELRKAQIAAPPTVVYTSDGTPQERTGIGRIADVTEVWEAHSESYLGEAYEAFTFVEDSGFSKRFYPVCSDQTIQTGKIEIILYHWHPNQNNPKHNQKGCFWIDGYLNKGQ